MKKLIFYLLLFVLIPLMAFPQSSSDEETVDKTGGIYPTEAQGDDTNTIPPNRSEIIKIPKLPRPQFTNELKIAAQKQDEIRPNYYVMEGYVDLTHQGFRLQADRAEYDAKTKDLIATGNVVLDQANQHLTGDRLELNLETKKGSMYNARGFVPPQIFFWGSRLDKIGEDEYKIYDGVFTECSQIVPHWRLNTTSARMTIDEYIHFKNFTLKAKTIPIFYSPYMMWPIKRDRSTGFLFPSFGPNSRKGFWVGGSFFWAMTKSMDSTYWLDHYADRGFGGGAEYRYAHSKEEDGNIRYYIADDSLLGTQWTVHGSVNQKLPGDFIAKGIVDYFSSFEYMRDYSNNVSRASSLTRTFQGFLTRNWSYYSLNILNNYVERESNANATSYFSHLPEIEFKSRSQKLGPTPFYGSILTSYDYLGQGRNAPQVDIHNSFNRYDVFPTISWPITYLSWLTVTPTYGYRVTHWSKSRDLTGVIDDPLTRRYSEVTLDLRGPNFGKIFDTPGNGYSKKWKHAIEPQVTYRHRQDIPNQQNIIGVDSDVDFVEGARAITYSITNLLYAKRPVKEEKEYEPDEYHYYDPEPLETPVESVWEFISWKISQTYQFESDSFNPDNPTLRAFTPINSHIRVNLRQNYSVEFSTDYDIDFHQLTRLRVTSNLQNKGSWYTNTHYTYENPTRSFRPRPGQPQATSESSIQTIGGVGLWKNRLALNGEIGYDFTDNGLLGAGFGVTWNDDCFSVGVQYRRFNQIFRTDGREDQITFSISLPNIGNLVSFQSGASAKRF